MLNRFSVVSINLFREIKTTGFKSFTISILYGYNIKSTFNIRPKDDKELRVMIYLFDALTALLD